MQVSNALGIGGTEKTLQLFSEHLNKSIFNVYIVAIFEGGIREQILREKGYEVKIVKNNLDEFKKFLIEKRIQIVHIHRSGDPEPFAIQAAKDANIPVVLETNVFGGIDASKWGKLIDKHLFISKMCALRYQRKTGMKTEEFMKKNAVLYYPVDIEVHGSLSKSEIESHRTLWGINPDDFVIGRISRPDILKWGNICLRMFPHLIKRIPNVKYIIVGCPELIKQRIRNKKEFEKIIFLDLIFDRQLAIFYNIIDVLAHSSKIGESFGLTIAEAMEAKKPVVVNSTPLQDNAQIELVDNGRTGFIANNPKEYANAVAFLLRNLTVAKRFGENGHSKVKKEYNSLRIIKILENTYISLLLQKVIPISEEIMNYYKNTEELDTKWFESFRNEYNTRMKKHFNRYDIFYEAEVLIWKYFLNLKAVFISFKFFIENYHDQGFLNSLKMIFEKLIKKLTKGK